MSNSPSSPNEQDRVSGFFIPLHPANEVDAIQFGDWFRYFLTKKWLIILVTSLAAILSIAVALLSTSIYQAEVLLVPNSEQNDSGLLSGLADQFGNLSSIAGLNVQNDSTVQEAIATLKSRDFTLRFVRSQNLMPILFEDEWDAASNDWRDLDPQEVPTDWDAYELFDSEVRSVFEEDNGLVTVRIEWRDPALAARWANSLVADLNQLMRRRAIDEATTNISYLQQELQSTSIVELRTAISRLIESEVNNAMLARTRDEYSFRVIDPAMAPDADRFVRPNRILTVLIGTLGGFFLALIALIATRRRSRD